MNIDEVRSVTYAETAYRPIVRVHCMCQLALFTACIRLMENNYIISWPAKQCLHHGVRRKPFHHKLWHGSDFELLVQRLSAEKPFSCLIEGHILWIQCFYHRSCTRKEKDVKLTRTCTCPSLPAHHFPPPFRSKRFTVLLARKLHNRIERNWKDVMTLTRTLERHLAAFFAT